MTRRERAGGCNMILVVDGRDETPPASHTTDAGLRRGI